MSIKEIAKGINSPEYFIAKILQDLSRKKMIQSAKGPNGGFYLNKQSLKYSLADVVKTIDGDAIFSGCGLGLEHCSETRPCPIHHKFKKIRKELYDMLRSARLGEFNERLEKSLLHLRRA